MAYTYSLLASSTVGVGGAASITFNNIPQNYTDLVLKVSSRDTNASANNGNIKVTFNGTSASYTNRYLRGSGTGTASATGATAYIDGGIGSATDAAGNTASTFSNVEIYIPNYAGTNNKSVSVDAVSEDNSSTAYAGFDAGLWSNVTAITNILLSPTTLFAQYSTASLYGIRVEL